MKALIILQKNKIYKKQNRSREIGVQNVKSYITQKV